MPIALDPIPGIIVDGQLIEIAGVPCLDGPDFTRTRPRKSPPEFTVIHHTAGEGSPDTLFRVLERRRLSVHFLVNRGRIIQFADPARTVTLHAGKANNPSVGIEVTSRGLAPSHPKRKRVEYDDEMHGRKPMRFLRFSRADVVATTKLVEAIHAGLALPLTLPNVGGKVPRRVLTRSELQAATVVGHFHVTRRKIDPSPHILDEMSKTWRGCAA